MKKAFLVVLFVLFTFISQVPALALDVYYNTKTHIYHSLNCHYAKICTVNCIKIDIKEAQRRGGRPCKICGGR